MTTYQKLGEWLSKTKRLPRWHIISVYAMAFGFLMLGLFAGTLRAERKNATLRPGAHDRDIASFVSWVAGLDGEKPTVATITNPEKLSGTPFFAHAKRGDKILVYSASGRAVIYRPETGAVIEMTSMETSE